MAIDESEDQLNRIESVTLGHYDRSAEAFFSGTVDHDVSQNYAALLDQLPPGKSLDILDFGCGPGRDLKYFRELGHNPIGLDGSEAFCQIARNYGGCDVLHQTFLNLSLPAQAFDGVFANASLFHVPSSRLTSVLDGLHTTLRGDGVLFMSNPRGDQEGWSGDRYGHYMEIDKITLFLEHAGFNVVNHYYRPSGKPREQQPWLAVVSRKAL